MKKIVRLTENDLHRIIKESVKRVLKEDAFGGVEKQENPASFRLFSIGDNKGQAAKIKCTLLDGKTQEDLMRSINNKVTDSYRFKNMRIEYEELPGKYASDWSNIENGSIKTGEFIDIWCDDDLSNMRWQTDKDFRNHSGGGRFTTISWADGY